MYRIIFTAILVLTFRAFVFADADEGKNREKDDNETGFSTYKLSGSVIDQESSEKLVCAKIEIEGTGISVFTDIRGDFSIPSLEPGSYNLKVTYIAYQEKEITNFQFDSEKDIIINLKPL